MKKIFSSVAALFIVVAAFAQGFQMPPMPENVVYFEHNFNLGQVEGRSYNHAPTLFIYPDRSDSRMSQTSHAPSANTKVALLWSIEEDTGNQIISL